MCQYPELRSASRRNENHASHGGYLLVQVDYNVHVEVLYSVPVGRYMCVFDHFSSLQDVVGLPRDFSYSSVFKAERADRGVRQSGMTTGITDGSTFRWCLPENLPRSLEKTSAYLSIAFMDASRFTFFSLMDSSFICSAA